MAAITISALASFFSDEPKSIQRGENHYKSNHIESCEYSDGIIRGSVQASMKKKSYNVTVSETMCCRSRVNCQHCKDLLFSFYYIQFYLTLN